MKKGVVVKSTGSWYTVKMEEETIACRIVGRFRLEGHRLTNPVAVGDQVMVEVEDLEERTGVIRKILPRTNYVLRQSPRRKHFMHLMAANIDQAVLIVTLREQMLKSGFLDRYLLMTGPYGSTVIILFHKRDGEQSEDITRLDDVA